MRAYTLWQPWASLVIEGAKPFEFRGYRPPPAVRGQRIVIHAAARKVSRDEIGDILEDLDAGGELTAQRCLVLPKAHEILARMLQRPDEIVYSAGLGTAIVGEPRDGIEIARDEFGARAVEVGELDANWGWPMLDIERWPRPVPMRGNRGPWVWPPLPVGGLLP